MKSLFALLGLILGMATPIAGAQFQTGGPDHNPQASAQSADSQDRNLLLALSRVAGMRVCDRMRNRFRTLTAAGRDNEPASSGTLWIEECVADSQGTRLSMSLGGQGWRWIYRKKRQAGAEFTVGQYVAFAVNIGVEGTIDAAYDPEKDIFNFWYRPSSEPDVSFRPLGDVEVNPEGLWSSVVGTAASLVSRSPEARAREQVQSRGRETFKKRFSRGYSATLDFCTGRVDMGFGINAENKENGATDSSQLGADGDDQAGEATPAYMHPGGLILDGPHDVDPSEFAVTIESDGPLDAALICVGEATRLARAFLDDQQLPEVEALTSTQGRSPAELQIQQSFVSCPVVMAFRAVPGSPEQAFGFQYQVESAPMMEPAQQCKRESD